VEERRLQGSFHGGIKDRCLLGLRTVWLYLETTFRKTHGLHIQGKETIESFQLPDEGR
jgi:hypothetical protein